VIGAGAAGLMAALTAARAAPGARVVALDGAARLGAKILIAGGGRCNVTHHAVTERDFSGSTPAAIRRILRTFDVDATRAFFEAEGVALKQEATGKLFPVSDRARDVLDALIGAARRAGVVLDHPRRVTDVTATGRGFAVSVSDPGPRPPTVAVPVSAVTDRSESGPYLTADVVILAAGGCSVPRTGSDGSGHHLARHLGLPITPRVFPALVPLVLPDHHPLRTVSGLTAEVGLTVVSSTGRHGQRVTGSLLCTHQGLSGPAVLDVSRHWQAARFEDPAAGLLVDWLPATSMDELDARLQRLGARPIRRALAPPLPERLADTLCALADLDPAQPAAVLSRDGRKRLVQTCGAWRAPVTGTRGFAVAEVTAGGVPLAALTVGLEARHQAGLFVCGEVCDVDGRIGGFNFQWAWASGTAAGRAAAAAIHTALQPVSR
jgi:predicted flavoprotein YhiN